MALGYKIKTRLERPASMFMNYNFEEKVIMAVEEAEQSDQQKQE
jgi:hypothetical protein